MSDDIRERVQRMATAELSRLLSAEPRWPAPEHPNAEPHRRLMAKLATMTDEEIVQTSVRAGIHTPDGKLTAAYAEPRRRRLRAAAAKP